MYVGVLRSVQGCGGGVQGPAAPGQDLPHQSMTGLTLVGLGLALPRVSTSSGHAVSGPTCRSLGMRDHTGPRLWKPQRG